MHPPVFSTEPAWRESRPTARPVAKLERVGSTVSTSVPTPPMATRVSTSPAPTTSASATRRRSTSTRRLDYRYRRARAHGERARVAGLGRTDGAPFSSGARRRVAWSHRRSRHRIRDAGRALEREGS
ncbi:hypothetical protein MBEHAL_2254 [Halarchaeum acidiphilum MH1-52-1]|uniref:Uncharacterized protein n=1 Tax=Halarchaeum acidiphilum MH1-52-1 TaxID=1261545 RepID=U3A749_9EURY|nr:hypothetical protein MBEHAL_2254 [Halarchaeum acidiphilum MH1-52-1]